MLRAFRGFCRGERVSPRRGKSRGQALVIIAFAIPVFLAVASLVLNVLFISTTKSQLRTAADAGALAGASRVYQIIRIQDPERPLSAEQTGTVVQTILNQVQKNAPEASTSVSFNGLNIEVLVKRKITLFFIYADFEVAASSAAQIRPPG